MGRVDGILNTPLWQIENYRNLMSSLAHDLYIWTHRHVGDLVLAENTLAGWPVPSYCSASAHPPEALSQHFIQIDSALREIILPLSGDP
jgi:hypothetical protein